MTAFTPGPWTVCPVPHEDTIYAAWIVPPDEHESVVADVIKLDDAHLIAAAPEMFAVLEDLWDAWTEHGRVWSEDTWTRVGEALAKAAGEQVAS